MARKRKKVDRDIPYEWDDLRVEQLHELVEQLDMYGLRIYDRFAGDHREFVRTIPRVANVFVGYLKPKRRGYVVIGRR